MRSDYYMSSSSNNVNHRKRKSDRDAQYRSKSPSLNVDQSKSDENNQKRPKSAQNGPTAAPWLGSVNVANIEEKTKRKTKKAKSPSKQARKRDRIKKTDSTNGHVDHHHATPNIKLIVKQTSQPLVQHSPMAEIHTVRTILT